MANMDINRALSERKELYILALDMRDVFAEYLTDSLIIILQT
jgi:hypothetical protein